MNEIKRYKKMIFRIFIGICVMGIIVAPVMGESSIQTPASQTYELRFGKYVYDNVIDPVAEWAWNNKIQAASTILTYTTGIPLSKKLASVRLLYDVAADNIKLFHAGTDTSTVPSNQKNPSKQKSDMSWYDKTWYGKLDAKISSALSFTADEIVKGIQYGSEWLCDNLPTIEIDDSQL